MDDYKPESDPHYWGKCSPKCTHRKEVAHAVERGTIWEDQPAELRALGKRAAIRVYQRVMDRAMDRGTELLMQIRAENAARQVGMSAEEIKADDKVRNAAAREELHEAISESEARNEKRLDQLMRSR